MCYVNVCVELLKSSFWATGRFQQKGFSPTSALSFKDNQNSTEQLVQCATRRVDVGDAAGPESAVVIRILPRVVPATTAECGISVSPTDAHLVAFALREAL